jgi:hypothetical protein
VEGERAEPRSTAAARNGRTTPAKERDEDADDEDDDESVASVSMAGDEGDDDDEEGGAVRSSHKNIPTWADAIGVLVETNMQSRKNSPQRPSSGRERGGRGRGRGRGGRGRGSS